MIQFSDNKLKSIIDEVPGIGENVKNFKMKVPMDMEMTKHLEELYDLDTVLLLREQMNMETALHLIKEMHAVLVNIPASTVDVDGLIKEISGEQTVMTNVRIASLLQDNKDFVAAPPQDTYNKTVFPIGMIGRCKVYVNSLIPYSETSVFVIKENVLSLKSISEGRMFDGVKESMLIEGSYSTYNGSANRHFNVTV